MLWPSTRAIDSDRGTFERDYVTVFVLGISISGRDSVVGVKLIRHG